MKAWATLFLTFLLLAGPGCGHWQYDLFPAPSWNPKGLATPRIINQDRVFIYPRQDTLRHRRAGILIFRTDNVVAELAPAITLVFYQELLAQRVFAEIKYIPETFNRILNTPPLAKRHNVDVLVLGEVPYYLDGGTVGTSAIQVDLKVVDAEKQELLWSYSDSVKASPRPIISLMVVETRPYPTPAMGNLTTRLAKRMAQTLAEGKPPSPPGGIAAFFKGEE